MLGEENVPVQLAEEKGLSLRCLHEGNPCSDGVMYAYR